MRIGIGIGVSSALCLRTVRAPRSLFRAGDQGFWLDPGDLSSLSQDADGTVPVTAFGQPVGRVQDQSGNGLHALQANADLRPLSARVPTGGVRNLFRNSRFAGFSAGPLGAWATASEGMTISGTAGAGNPNITIIAVGADSVGEWIDVRVHGVNTSGVIRFINIIDEQPVAAAAGTSRVVSVDLQLIANFGPNTPVVTLFSHWRNAENTQLSGGDEAVPAPTTTMTRYTSASSVAPSNTVTMRNKGVYMRVGIGETVDYTLRIRRMQVEFGVAETLYQATRQFGADVTEAGKADRFALLNDLRDDALGATLPAGTYTVAFVDDAGVTILTGQALSGAFAIPGPARHGCMAVLPSTARSARRKPPA